MTNAMKELLAGLHVGQTENQKWNNEANLYNARGHWIAEFAYADVAEAMVAAVNEYDGMRATIARLLCALFVALPDEVLMLQFRDLPVVAQAEKYAPDWAEGMTK